MKELSLMDINAVSGAGLIEAFNGAVVGATSYAFIGGKWGGLSGLTTFGVSQLVGTALGAIVGGVGGGLYGLTHTDDQTEAFFASIVSNAG